MADMTASVITCCLLGTTNALQKHLVRNLTSRGLFSDAGKDRGNGARTRRSQWAVTSRACW
jgi:hypothetical protein